MAKWSSLVKRQLVPLNKGWRIYGIHANNGTQKDLFGMWHWSLPHSFFLMPDQHLCCIKYVYINTSDCVEIVYELPLVLYTTMSEAFLHRSGVMWGFYQIFIVGVPAWPWRQIHDIGQNILQSSCKAGISSSFSHFHSFFLITFLKEAFIRNWVIILWIYYTIMIVICINNNNNAVTNNNYGRLQDIILLFRIPKGTWKNLFKIYRHCWHAPSKKFASPAVHNMYTLALNSCHMCVIWYFLFYFLETTWNSFGSYSCLSTSPFVTSAFRCLPLRPWTLLLCCCG